jgi:hypothetical protein
MPLQTLSDLLALIARLPARQRADAVAELDRALELDAGARELALGLLALDLVPAAAALRSPQLSTV